MLIGGRIIPTTFGKGWRFPGSGPLLGLGTVMAPLGVSFDLLIEDQVLVLPVILVPFDSNWFMLCPWLCHSFKSCALPLSLLLQYDMKIIRSLYLLKVVLLIKLLEDECNNCL